MKLWAFGHRRLGVRGGYDIASEFWDTMPHELAALASDYWQEKKLEDAHFALAPWVIASVNTGKGKAKPTLSDFQLLGAKKKRGARTPDEIRAVMQSLGAVRKKNGT